MMVDGSGHLKTLKIVPKNAKIADITHADTNKHTLDLAAALSETRKIVSVSLPVVIRMAGTGELKIYPNEGSASVQSGLSSYGQALSFILANGTNRLQYSLTVANDDWDIYCGGYVVEV